MPLAPTRVYPRIPPKFLRFDGIDDYVAVSWDPSYCSNDMTIEILVLMPKIDHREEDIDIANGIWKDRSGYGNDGTIHGATLVERSTTPSRILAPTRLNSVVR